MSAIGPSRTSFPGAYDAILSFILGLGGLCAVIYGAAIAGSEWSWGTLKNAVARGESRSRYMLWSFASVAFIIAVGLLFAFAVGVVAALVGASLAGVSTTGLNDAATLGRLPELFARGWLAIVEEGALGFAIATLARSQLASIGAGIALYFGGTLRRALPARHRQIPAVQRGECVRLDGVGRRVRRWRSADRGARREYAVGAGRRVAHRIAGRRRGLHGASGDQRVARAFSRANSLVMTARAGHSTGPRPDGKPPAVRCRPGRPRDHQAAPGSSSR